MRAFGRVVLGITGCVLGIYALLYAFLLGHPVNAWMPALYFEAAVDAIGAFGCLIAVRHLAPRRQAKTETTAKVQHVS